MIHKIIFLFALLYLCWDQAVYPAPQQPISHLHNGYRELAAGRHEHAIAYLSVAVKQQPENLDARRYLAMAYLRSGHATNAQRILLDLVQREDKAADRAILAEALFYSGMLSEAEKEYKNALRIDPQLSSALLGLINTHIAQGQIESALSACVAGAHNATDPAARKQFADKYNQLKNHLEHPEAQYDG